jgi:hypothetical protein
MSADVHHLPPRDPRPAPPAGVSFCAPAQARANRANIAQSSVGSDEYDFHALVPNRARSRSFPVLHTREAGTAFRETPAAPRGRLSEGHFQTPFSYCTEGRRQEGSDVGEPPPLAAEMPGMRLCDEPRPCFGERARLSPGSNIRMWGVRDRCHLPAAAAD